MKHAIVLGFGLALLAGAATQVLAQSPSEDILNDNTMHDTDSGTMAPVPVYQRIETHTTTKTVVPVNADGIISTGPAQPETLQQAVGPQPFHVIMPNGENLRISGAEWWKDERLNGYTRFWYDTVANAYRPVVEKNNPTYQRREDVWCTSAQSAAGRC